MLTRKRITTISIIALSILFVAIMFSFTTGAENGGMSQAEILKEVGTIKAAISRIESGLTGITTPATTPATAPTAPTAPTMQSPRQIDRPPIGDEKVRNWIVEAQKMISDPRELNIITGLLTWNKGGDFQNSLKKQAIEWLQGKNTKPSPLSSKQMAWAGYVTQPEVYPDPYTITELYPYGNPKQ